ncbi:hypothetical protein, partial [Herbiconiux daphne]
MKPINGFTFGTFDSKNFDLEIERELTFTSPDNDVQLIEIDGVDGDLAVSRKRFKGTDFSFPCRLRLDASKSVEAQAQAISNGLKTQEGWKLLNFSGMPNTSYVAMFTDSYDVERTTKLFGKAVLKFRLKPYAYLRTGLVAKTTTAAATAIKGTNLGSRPSKPI